MRSYNTKIVFESKQDQQKIVDMLILEKQIWNKCSELVFKHKPVPGLKTVHKCCYYKLKTLFPSSPSQLIIRAMKDVSSTLRTIKANKQKINKPPKKKHLSVRLDKRLYSINNKLEIRLTTLEKRIPATIHLYAKIKEMFSLYKFGDPLIFLKNNELFISFPFENPTTGLILNPQAIGIDLGINNLASTSEGIIYVDKEYLKQKRTIRFLKRQLQAKKTKSAKKKLKKIKRKESNKTKNMCHNLSKKILQDTKANVIVIENLAKLKKNTKRNKEFNNKHSQIPYFMIKEFLTYKAPLFNKRVETVNPAYTSQTDSRTQKRDGIRYKGRYTGKDGKVLHSDINASVNIAIKSKLPVICNTIAIYGQGVVNRPIVCQSAFK